MDILELNQAVEAYLPDDFLTAAVRSAFLARKLAHGICRSEFEQTEVVNVEPFFVRGKMDALLRDVAEREPGFSSQVVQCSGWNHTEIAAGPFTLTPHAVDYPCGLVHNAEYRRALAESQGSLISADVIPGAKLYALLLHSPFRGRSAKEKFQYGYLPGSVYLAFPEAGLKRYAHQINLFEKFPGLVDSLLPREWDSKARLNYRWQARQREKIA
jgi:hypothetical protein